MAMSQACLVGAEMEGSLGIQLNMMILVYTTNKTTANINHHISLQRAWQVAKDHKEHASQAP